MWQRRIKYSTLNRVAKEVYYAKSCLLGAASLVCALWVTDVGVALLRDRRHR